MNLKVKKSFSDIQPFKSYAKQQKKKEETKTDMKYRLF